MLSVGINLSRKEVRNMADKKDKGNTKGGSGNGKSGSGGGKGGKIRTGTRGK